MEVKLVNIYELLEKISTFSTPKVFLTYSEETKRILSLYSVSIDYIVDKNHENITLQNDIQVISYDNFYSLHKPIVIIASNHVISLIEEIKKNNFQCTIFVLYKNIKAFQDEDFFNYFKHPYLIDSPLFYNNFTQSQQIFIKKLTQVLLTNNISFSSFSDNELDMFSPIYNNNDSILLSYHTKGKSKRNIYRYKNSYLKNYVVIDSNGYSGWHSLRKNKIDNVLKNITDSEANIFFEHLTKSIINQNQSFYTQDNLPFDFPKQFIFFPLQVYSDSVMEISYFNPLALLHHIANSLYESKIPLVIKPHPKCKDIEFNSFIYHLEKEKKIIIYNGSIHQAIKKAQAIYVINSGVGFEALLHLKPVVTFGSVEYEHLTHSIKTESELHQLLKNPIKKLSLLKKQNIKKFLYFYIKYKLIDISNKSEIQNFIKKTLFEKTLNNILNSSKRNFSILPYIKRHKWVQNKEKIVIAGIPYGYRRFISPFFDKKYNILFFPSLSDSNILNLLLTTKVKKLYLWNTYSNNLETFKNKFSKYTSVHYLDIGLIRSYGMESNETLPLSIITYKNLEYQNIKKLLNKIGKKKSALGLKIQKTITKSMITRYNSYIYGKFLIQDKSIIFINTKLHNSEHIKIQLNSISQNYPKHFIYYYSPYSTLYFKEISSEYKTIPNFINWSSILQQNVHLFITDCIFNELELYIFKKNTINLNNKLLKTLLTKDKYSLEKLVFLFYIKFSQYRQKNIFLTIQKIQKQQNIYNFTNNLQRS